MPLKLKAAAAHTRRNIALGGPKEQRERQERSYENMVTRNPHYEVILASLREGISVPEISRHFAMNGWIDVNERTFAEALRIFRRKRQKSIEGYPLDAKNIDNEISPNLPQADVENTLHQLLRLQKLRIGIDYSTEKSIGKLFNTTVKEVEIATKIAETILKSQGRIKDGGSRHSEPVEPSVNDDLNKIKKEEEVRDRLHGLTRQLAETNA